MRHGALLVLVACLVFLTGAQAVPLDAHLHWRQAALADGLLVALPASAGAVFRADPAPDADLVGDLLLESTHVRATVHQFGDGSPNLAQHTYPYNAPMDLHEVTVVIKELGSGPRTLTQDSEAASPTSQAELANARCDLERLPAEAGLAFPGDGGAADSGWWWQPQGRGRLSGDCEAAALEHRDPSRTYVYGMTVVLRSREGTHEIFTGSRPAGVAPGGVRLRLSTVTEILEVEALDEPVAFHLPHAAHVKVMAPEFLLDGRFAVGPAQGAIAWGPETREGELDGLDAEGRFRLTVEPDAYTRVTGDTSTAPPVDASDSAAAPAPPWTPLALAGGAAATLLIGYALWSLLAARRPEAALHHPRRSGIYEVVRREPGVEANTVARSLGLHPAKVHYHLRRLELAGYVVCRKVGGRTALFPANEGYRGREAQVALLRRRSLARLHDLTQNEPGLDQFELADKLRVGQPQVSRNLCMLAAVGLVRFEVAAGRRRYFGASVPVQGNRFLPPAPVPGTIVSS